MKKLFALSVFLFIGIICINAQFETGLVFDVPSYRGTPYKMKLSAGTYSSMPTSASLEQYCPTPGNQGAYGTCVAFAAAYHLRTIIEARQLGLTDKSQIDQLVFSPTFVYENIKDEGDGNCQGGSNPILALELFKGFGVATNNTVPYSCGGGITSESILEALDYKIQDYQILFLPDETDDSFKINSVKKGIAEGYPILLCFIVPKSFYAPGTVWHPTDDDGGPSGQHGRHAMCIVGYDDNKEGGAFRVLNSWGADWADGGYVWIRYADFTQYALGALQAYPIQTAPTPEPPTPDPQPSPAEDFVLKGSVRFETNMHVPMPAFRTLTRNLVVEEENTPSEDMTAYKMQDSYSSGTRFRFFITTNTQSYIYAFATDLTAKINKILPYDDLMSPLIGANSTVAFPSDTKVVRMDEQKGTDYLLMLYSNERLDVDAMLRSMSQTAGGLTTKMQAALGDRLIDNDNISYNTEGIGFTVKEQSMGNVVPLMIEIQHH